MGLVVHRVRDCSGTPNYDLRLPFMGFNNGVFTKVQNHSSSVLINRLDHILIFHISLSITHLVLLTEAPNYT